MIGCLYAPKRARDGVEGNGPPEIFLQKQVEQVIRRSVAAKSPLGHARMAIV